jgi:hypothetical protein
MNDGQISTRQEVIMPTSKSETSVPAEQMLDDTPDNKGNYEAVRYNAMKHGILSRLTVLPHEDPDEFAGLLAALVHEHQPAGLTEAHLVEELASIIWRKRRVLQAEYANINQGLKYASGSANSAISSAAPFENNLSGKDIDLRELLMLTPDEVIEHQAEASHALEVTLKAAEILRQGKTDAYKKALRTLLPDSCEWWQEYVEEMEYQENAEGLSEFIAVHLEPFCRRSEKVARYHAEIKAQTLGEGLRAHQLEKLNRYETHLDRKFQRTLSMLVKLKEIRGGK